MLESMTLCDIANRVMQGDFQYKKMLGALDEGNLIQLHKLVTAAVPELTPAVRRNLTSYVRALPRLHRGLFWKTFIKNKPGIATLWYRGSEEVVSLVLGALACFPVVKLNGSWIQEPSWKRSAHPTQYAVYVHCLDTVLAHTV